MRKLKLQVQLSIDGYCAGPNGELDWMTWELDDALLKYITDITDASDTILLGRKMTDEFVTYWTNALKNPESPEYVFAQKMVYTPKIVFSKTLERSIWENTSLAKGPLTDEIAELKKKEGKDIVVYGGANFVSNLIKENLIDEYHFFINPVMLGKGMTISRELQNKLPLKPVHATKFACGVIVLQYQST